MPSRLNQAVIAIALPMIISNITTPLLGLVDTAVVGHLEHSYYLGAVSVGAMITTFIYWLCGFLRMSTTGLTAQAIGKKSNQQAQILVQGGVIALALSLLVLVFQQGILTLGLNLAAASDNVSHYASQYFNIRIWSMPASLLNLVLMGWLIAQHKVKLLMWVQIAVNLLNILLDLLFVMVFDWGVAGVASASVLVEYTALVIYLYAAFQLVNFSQLIDYFTDFKFNKLKAFIAVNRDILLRTLLLQVCFTFITFQGARLGDDTLAANAVLMNFLMLISLGLDGIAYSAEVLIGKAYGAGKKQRLLLAFKLTRNWNLLLALAYSLLFWLGGEFIIGLMTDIEAVRINSQNYLIYLVLLPIIACWCFLYDGVFIGLADSKAMRNSMLISVALVFFPVWFILQELENHALWIALLSLMAARGISLAWLFKKRY